MQRAVLIVRRGCGTAIGCVAFAAVLWMLAPQEVRSACNVSGTIFTKIEIESIDHVCKGCTENVGVFVSGTGGTTCSVTLTGAGTGGVIITPGVQTCSANVTASFTIEGATASATPDDLTLTATIVDGVEVPAGDGSCQDEETLSVLDAEIDPATPVVCATGLESCRSATFTFDVAAAGTDFEWTLLSGASLSSIYAEIDPASGSSSAGSQPATFVASVTGYTTPGTYVLKVTPEGLDCCAATIEVRVVDAEIDPATPIVCATGSESCRSGTFTFDVAPADTSFEWTLMSGASVESIYATIDPASGLSQAGNQMATFVASISGYTTPGSYVLKVVPADLDCCAATIGVYVLNIDLDVDTDRDGVVEDDGDEVGEDNWVDDLGAIYCVNFDADEGRMVGGVTVPDAIHFASTGVACEEDFTLAVGEDLSEIAPLIIRKIADEIPSGVKVYLKAATQDLRCIHVYNKIEHGATVIWGTADPSSPSAAEIDITDWVNPVSPDFTGATDTGHATFGVEGLFFRFPAPTAPAHLEFDGYVDFTLEVRNNGTAVCSDSVRMKVAPWIMSTRNQGSLEIWMSNEGDDNDETLYSSEAPSGCVGVDHSGQLHTPGDVYPWCQDYLETGYTQRPGGPKTHIVFRLPYFGEYSDSDFAWPQTTLLSPTVGVFTIGSNHFGGNSDAGGNLEALPPNATYGLGRIAKGTGDSGVGGSDELRGFLTAQEVQSPIYTVPTEWLAVGHIDEILSFLRNGNVLVANPQMAWTLMEDMDAASQQTGLFFATGTVLPQGGTLTATTPTGLNRLYDGPAVGAIQATPVSGLVDGTTFSVSASSTSTVIFECSTDGVPATGHVAVDLTSASTAADVAIEIATAVNGVSSSTFTVSATTLSGAVVHLWNTTPGTAGNQAIDPGSSGLSVEGMNGGNDSGRDFTSDPWNYVRVYTFTTAGVPTGGQTAEITDRHNGWIEIGTCWNTGSKIIEGGGHDFYAYSRARRPADEVSVGASWDTEPVSGDVYVLCEGAKQYNPRSGDDFPAVVSVAEVLADVDFATLNVNYVQSKINSATAIVQAAIGSATFVSVPSLFFGNIVAGDVAEGLAFNPGPANLQPANNNLYINAQFGPGYFGNSHGEFGTRTKSEVGTGTDYASGDVYWVDDWWTYHRNMGELHCGSIVIRQWPVFDWWDEL